ncbi:MAG: YidC/Oxa1 family membrane protein insertase [Solirubrobacteraceae bacterium]
MHAVIEPLQTLIEVLDSILRFFHDSFGVGWGFSIILLTVVVRIVLLPLTVKQFKSMQSMARLAPEIKALQQKHKDDKSRQQQEMMAFYKEHQVNPFGSCLPLLLQMPFFISLFYMLRKDLKIDICGDKLTPFIKETGRKIADVSCDQVDPGSGQFLFIPDITHKATGGVLVILIVLYIGSQLLSSVLMSVSADRNQRLLMIGLPFLFTTFIISFPAGLIVYWITTNLWTVGQQFIIRKRMGPMMPPKVALAGAAAVADEKPAKRGRGGAPPPPAEKPVKPSGPPPSARKKKKRSGRRR